LLSEFPRSLDGSVPREHLDRDLQVRSDGMVLVISDDLYFVAARAQALSDRTDAIRKIGDDPCQRHP
jgi:hypothetical protein